MATPLGPEARYAQLEAISLAFVTSLQLLPARQRAVLILRDVLGYQASEVADMLESTVDSINSALKRARASVRSQPASGDREPPPARDSHAELAVAAAFVRAWESADLEALVALLTADVGVSMPPIPFEYHGREDVARFCGTILKRRSHNLVPTRANGQPAFGVYLRAAGDGIRHGAGLFVLTLSGDRISAMTRFESSVLPWFALPASLPANDSDRNA
jgi:RNA polymerase sigma-70 factor (ECF subfamily)